MTIPPASWHALDVAAWITHEKRDNAQAGVKGLVKADGDDLR